MQDDGHQPTSDPPAPGSIAAPPPTRSAPRRGLRFLVRWLASRAVFAYLLYSVMIFGIQRSILFPRQAVPQIPPGREPAGLQRLSVAVPEGRVEAWFLPAGAATNQAKRPAVVYAHGNAERIELWPEMLEPYRRMGISVLLPEYRGYGNSAGSPSEEAITSDFVAFYDDLILRPEIDPARIVFHGRSLGGGVVCSLARQRPCAAMILESTFTSVRDMARKYLVPGFFVLDPFDNLEVVRTSKAPLLIAHGRQDPLIPFKHAEKLLAAAGSRAKLIAYDAGHNDFPPNPTIYFREIESFLREHHVLD